MAFIDGQQDDEEYGQGQGQQPLVGQGSAQVGPGTGAAAGGPAGAGGSGFTNIQNYLKANEGDTGSSQALNKTVGSQFDKEKDTYTGDSQAFLKGAYDQVDKSKISNDDAEGAIKTSGASYNWSGSQGDDYQNNVKKFQDALTGQYSGPKEYSYGFGADTQNYGSALKDNQGFDSLMNQVYSKSAARPLTSGQFELQKQFDTGNASLNDSRASLSGKYDEMSADRDNVVKNTTDALGGVEQQYRTNQNKLRDFLGSKSNDYEQQIGQAEAAARAEYGNTFNTGKTGNATVGWDRINNVRGNNPSLGAHQAIDAWSPDLTWRQMQNENNNRMYNWSSGRAPLEFYQEPEFDRRAGLLGNFYFGQNAQYASTGDEQERWYNTVQDFLNSGADRKKQGFNVTGR